MPEVSVIVPVYNARDHLENCLYSLLVQSYSDIEILVIDDASTDDSVSKLQNVLSDQRVKFLQNSENMGVSATRNVGIENAIGRYIAFCDSDDIWYPTKLEKQLAAMKSSDTAVSHSSVYYVSDRRKTMMAARPVVTLKDMKIRNWIANSSGMYDCEKIGKVYQSKLRHEDYIMWCEILKKNGHSVGVSEPLVEINRSSSSLSGNKINSILWHFKAQRHIFNMGYLELVFCFLQNVTVRLISKMTAKP